MARVGFGRRMARVGFGRIDFLNAESLTVYYPQVDRAT